MKSVKLNQLLKALYFNLVKPGFHSRHKPVSNLLLTVNVLIDSIALMPCSIYTGHNARTRNRNPFDPCACSCAYACIKPLFSDY